MSLDVSIYGIGMFALPGKSIAAAVFRSFHELHGKI